MADPPPDPRSSAERRLALGRRLRVVRRRAGLTQDALAAAVGRKKNWLSDIERGRRGIDPHTLQRIAEITEHPIEYFTNPQFDAARREQLTRPATREDWELLYASEPERAAAHASLDEAFKRAREALVAERRPGQEGDEG